MQHRDNPFHVDAGIDKVSLLIDGVTGCISDEKIPETVWIDLSIDQALSLAHALINAATAKGK